MNNKGTLRLAILTADGQCPRWMWEPVQAAAASGASVLVTVVSLSGLPQRSHSWILELYASWERRRYRPAHSLLDNVDVAKANATQVVTLGAEDAARLARHLTDCRVDVLLATPDVDSASLSGIDIPVWRLQFGANEQRHSVPGFWEVAERSLSSVSLIETGPGSTPRRVLETIIARTDPRSWIRNQLGLVSKAADLLERWILPQVLRPYKSAEGIVPADLSHASVSSHAGLAVLRLLARFGNHARVSAWNVEQWQLVLGTSLDFGQLSDLKFLTPPADRFWCDPFLLQRDGALHVFFEEYLYASGKGHISVLSKSSSGEWLGPIKVLEQPYHMSYPFVFEHEGQLLMLPETTAAGRVELYRCVRFPDQWEFDRVLIDNFAGADSTLWFDDVRWWLFVDFRDELYIFYSDAPRGPWQPHLGNPVKSDSRSSRPAGRVFRQGDDVIRPSQDCSVQYGREVVFNKIVCLTACDFEEVEICRLQVPSNRNNACHTFNQLGDITIVDRLVERRKR